jgi:hypothetical protein
MDRFVKILRNSKCKILIAGIGSEFYGDDGIGIIIAEKLAKVAYERIKVTVCGDSPDRIIGVVNQEQPDELIFYRCNGVWQFTRQRVFLNSEDFASRFPQISTQKISLSLIARMIECKGKDARWLLEYNQHFETRSLLSAELIKPLIHY